LTPRLLISGYYTKDGDPSLIPRIQGKTLVLKDYTEVLSMAHQGREEVYSILRGAYDGRAERVFGNGVRREYTDCYFTIVAGVTSAIHGDTRATLGERFLKYELIPPGPEGMDPTMQVKQAMLQATGDDREHEQLGLEAQSVVRAFLDREWDPSSIPLVPDEMLERLVALSQLVAYLRAGVDRNWSGDLAYRPRPEIGTRLGKQLVKLLRFLALVHGEPVNQKHYELVERTAMYTGIGWSLDLLKGMVLAYPGGLSVPELAEQGQMAESTAYKKVGDLVELRIVERCKAKREPGRLGAPMILYRVADDVYQLCKRAGVLVARDVKEKRRK
jgi:hypothetical protein